MSLMIPNPQAYFSQFLPARDELLLEMEKEAQREEIPIVGPVVGELLYILAYAAGASRILELGTATGYSAIYLARGCQAIKGKVITLEIEQYMADRAHVNINKAGLNPFVEIRVADALKELTNLQGSFDLIFMDIEKADYIRALPDCRRLLRKGGLLVADNTGFQDADDFNRSISNHPKWRSVNLFSFLPLHSPQQDGLCIALGS